MVRQVSRDRNVHCCCNLRIAGAVVGLVQLIIVTTFIVVSCISTQQTRGFSDQNSVTVLVWKSFLSAAFVATFLSFFGIYYIRYHILLPLLFIDALWCGLALLCLPVAIYYQSIILSASAAVQAGVFGYFLYVTFRCYQYVRDLRREMNVITIELKEVRRPMMTTASAQGATTTVVTLDKASEAEKGLLPPTYEQCVN